MSDEIRPIKGVANRDPGGYYLTRAQDAWVRVARYCQLYEQRKLDRLLAEIDANTRDEGIHPNAVLLMAVRLASALGKFHNQPASELAAAFSRESHEHQDIRDILWLPN